MDVFSDGAIYLESKGKKFQPPTTPMRFQLNEDNLQLVLSSFSVNQVVQTVLDTNLLVIPIYHYILRELVGVELTTTLLLPIVPELWYNYGHRNVSLIIKPVTGTQVDFSNQR